MKPVIVVSELTGRIYCATRYKRDERGNLVTSSKSDVTAQVLAILDHWQPHGERFVPREAATVDGR